MGKKYTVIILGITAILFLFSLFTTNENTLLWFSESNVDNVDIKVDDIGFKSKDGHYLSNHADILAEDWEDLNLIDSGFKDAREFMLAVNYYLQSISERLEIDNWVELHKQKYRNDYHFKPIIEFSFVDNESYFSHVKHYLKLKIDMNIPDFENNFSCLARDITRIIIGESKAVSLSEGLGLYMHDEFGLNINRFNYGIDVHSYAKYILSDFNSSNYLDNSMIKKLGTVDGIPSSKEIRSFYILSNSFCKYLIDQYGIDKFLDLYNLDYLEKTYDKVYDKNLDELKQEWIGYLNNYKNLNVLLKETISFDKDKTLIKKAVSHKNLSDFDGNLENSKAFLINIVFEKYLKETFGVDKFNELIEKNYNYKLVYGHSLRELQNMWIKFLKN